MSRTAREPVPWWQTALAVLLMVFLAAGFIALAVVTGRALRQLPPEVLTSIIAAFTAVMVAIVSAFLTRQLDRRRQAEAEQRAKRIPVYEEFVGGLLRTLGATTPKSQRKKPTEDDIARIMGEFTEKVIIWGSDDVLRAWLNVRGANFDRESGADPMAGMRLLEEFIFAVRKGPFSMKAGAV